MECLLIADDLTGACDAAVHFACHGRRVVVCTSDDAGPGDADVVAISTDSRERDPSSASALVAGAISEIPPARSSIVFKKVDSTFRGNVGPEIAAALEASGCGAAVVCPAYPALGRVVKAGRLSVTRAIDFEPVDIQVVLRGSGLDSLVLAGAQEIRKAVCGGARTVVLDATSDADLLDIANRTLALDRRILWVGSGGLAWALARSLPALPDAIRPEHHPSGALLFCIGSDHFNTAGQQSALLARTSAVLLHGCHTNAGEIVTAIADGHHVCLHLPRGRLSRPQVAQLLEGVSPGAVVLTGGDTAAFVCRAVGTRQIELYDEIATGIPVGVARGGQFDGLPVVTKSGAFGAPDALIQIADYFSCSR